MESVLVQRDAVDDVLRGISRALGTNHGHGVPGCDERLALEPHSTIEGYGKVLDDDEDLWFFLDRLPGGRARSSRFAST